MVFFFKNIVKYFFFCLSVYIILILVSGAFINIAFLKNLKYLIGGYGHTYTRMNEVKKHHPVDILFIGSSHAYRGFDVRIFNNEGLTAFNLGSSSQTPIQSKMLLQQYLKTLNPKLIVFEVFPNTFESDGIESTLDLLSNNKIDKYTFEMLSNSFNIKTLNTLIFAEIIQLFNLNKNYYEPIVKKEDTYINGGFVERKIEKYKSKNAIKKRYNLNKIQLNEFKWILHYLNENSIKFVLVQAPISKDLYSSVTNNNEVDSIYNTFGRYYNFNIDFNFNDSLFYDQHHLNQNGVNLFNSLFIEMIKKDKLIN